MEESKKVLIKNCLAKSSKAFEDAKFNYESKRFSVTLNRLYYSIFYAVMALAYKDDFITVKHKQLMGWFNRNYIHENKVFSIALSKIYMKAYNDRQESDYEVADLQEINEEDLKLGISSSKYFIDEVGKYLNQFL